MSDHARFLQVLPTRVRRNYTGGALLERWTASGNGNDNDQPEDWIASTIEAKNPGLVPVRDEGVTRALRPDGIESDLRREIARDPSYHLGAGHVEIHGGEIGFLAKILDSSIRLHIQAHPTAAFAREHLGSRYGKLEAYLILGARAGCEPSVLLGFRDAPTPAEWRRIIAEQDLTAMQARLNRLPVKAAEVWLVPGGMPHAIGEGVLMLEVMEPSDWVVRCEFVREGIVVPPAGRFMGRDLDFCLNIFDYRSHTEEEIRDKCQLQPHVLAQESGYVLEELVGPAHTDCFGVYRARFHAATAVPMAGKFRLLLVTAGEGVLKSSVQFLALSSGTRLLIPAGSNECVIEPLVNATLEVVFCVPGS